MPCFQGNLHGPVALKVRQKCHLGLDWSEDGSSQNWCIGIQLHGMHKDYDAHLRATRMKVVHVHMHMLQDTSEVI